MMFNRNVKLLKTNSFFLFGARGTGKSTLLESLFPSDKHIWIDLLDPDVEARYATRPGLLLDFLSSQPISKSTWIVIDEVQKVPALLNVVHSEIERHKRHFALTGSSARKLKRGHANLLAGRAYSYSLFPLTRPELSNEFDLEMVLRWGSLPKIFDLGDDERMEYLRTYANTYVKEEILAEQIVRRVQPFRAFLEVSAQMSGQILNYSKIARDIDSDPVSVQSYFEILEDTLLGFHLKPFHRSIRKRQRKNPKFYFFDTGVRHALLRTLNLPMAPQTSSYGEDFEHFIINEIHRLQTYNRLDWDLSYLRTKDDVEVDLIIERPGQPLALVEIKSKKKVDENDIVPLQRIQKDIGPSESFLLSQDPIPRKVGAVNILPWKQGLERLGL